MRRDSSANPVGQVVRPDRVVRELGPAVDDRPLGAVEHGVALRIDAHGEHDRRAGAVRQQARRGLAQRRRVQRSASVGQVHRAAAPPRLGFERPAGVDEEPDVGDRVVQHDVRAVDRRTRDVDREGLVEIGRRLRVERAEVDSGAVGVASAMAAAGGLLRGGQHVGWEVRRDLELVANRVEAGLDGGIGIARRRRSRISDVLAHRRAPMNMPFNAS